MDTGFWSITPGGGSFPEITGEPGWIDEQTFILPVRVKPGRMYEVMINMEGDRKFRTQAGDIIPSAVIDFSTALPQ